MSNIRKGIPHLVPHTTPKGNIAPHLSEDEIHNLIEPGYIFLDRITEKTDGQTFVMGFDSEGFYTRSSGTSDLRIRDAMEYVNRANERGNSISVANGFAAVHDSLLENNKLQFGLEQFYDFTQDEVLLSGEIFNNFLARPSETVDGHVKFIHTSYDPSKLGTLGMFVLHSHLEQNQWMSFQGVHTLGNEEIKFDHDVIEPLEPINIKTALHAYYSMAFDLDYVREHLQNEITWRTKVLQPKWGLETEGHVIHPSDRNPKAPRFKIVTERFKTEKANGW